MIPLRNLEIILAAAGLLSASLVGFSQTTAVHRLDGLTIQPQGNVALTLSGSAPSNFRNYHDLYVLESSADLVHWTPMATLIRTNKSTNALIAFDTNAANFSARFYRTLTNHLLTAIPKPTGPYPVGTITRLVTDPTETNRYNIKTNQSFMVSIWYPGQATEGVLPAPYMDRKIANSAESNYGFPAGVLSGTFGHAQAGVPLATGSDRFPIVLFSHPYQGRRTMGTDKVEDLASHGYVVVAIDHVNCDISAFPNGQVVYGMTTDLNIVTNPAAVLAVQRGVQDVRFVMDELTRWNVADPLFAGRLDLERIGIFGHSYGGSVAAETCRQEPRCKAGASLDGGSRQPPFLPFEKPFLMFDGNYSGRTPISRTRFGALYDALTQDAYWLGVKSQGHFEFVDEPWFLYPTSTARTRTSVVLRRYLLSFFNKYLKGEDDHLLDGPALDYPEINPFEQK